MVATILVPLSVGEVADRITILRVKLEHGLHVEAELQALLDIAVIDAHQGGAPLPDGKDTLALQEVNALLWDAENTVRTAQGFAFEQAARAIIELNNRRSEIKRRINMAAGSPVEERLYT